MLNAADVRNDTYRGGRFIRRWTIVDGRPRCLQDALDTATATEEEVASVRAANAIVAERLAAVEACESYPDGEHSDLIRAYVTIRRDRPEPPEPWAEPSPKWTTYQDALAVIAAGDRRKRKRQDKKS